MKKEEHRGSFMIQLYDHGEKIFSERGFSPISILRKISVRIFEKYRPKIERVN